MKNTAYEVGSRINSCCCVKGAGEVVHHRGVADNFMVPTPDLDPYAYALEAIPTDDPEAESIVPDRDTYYEDPNRGDLVFTGEAAACNHDRDEGGGACRFRKSYTLDGRLIEKCSGITFEFREPNLEKLPDYINLFAEFNPGKRK